MKKEKDPKPEDKKEDNFYSLFSKIVKHNPNKKKPPKPKNPQSS